MSFRIIQKFNILSKYNLCMKLQTRPVFANNMMIVRNLTNANRENFGTIKELTENLSKILGIESGYSPIPPSRSNLNQYLPKFQKELPGRSMQDSFLVGLIPLSSDASLQDRYITFLGHVRVGRLLEDMDIFAVMVAQKHILIPNLPHGVPSPYTLVTALIDRIDFTDLVPKAQEDIKISGHVSWVGTSSIEVIVWLEQKIHDTWHRITKSLFLIAARNPTNTRAAPVNPLVPANEIEQEIFSGGEMRKKNRILLKKQHVSKVIPDQEEQQIIHDLYLKTKFDDFSLKNRVLPPNFLWMEDCTLSNVVFSHPENRNLSNTVFGGFIMRQATELGWILGYKFSKYRPILKSISDINFNKPIAVNSLMQMHAYVVYTQLQFFQIVIYVEVSDPFTGKSETTNTFHFTYEIPGLVQGVVPRTYHEAMMYIDGRRHFLDVMEEHPNLQINSLTGEGIENKSKL